LQLRDIEAGEIWSRDDKLVTKWTAFSYRVISRHIANLNPLAGRAHKFERAVNDVTGPANRRYNNRSRTH